MHEVLLSAEAKLKELQQSIMEAGATRRFHGSAGNSSPSTRVISLELFTDRCMRKRLHVCLSLYLYTSTYFSRRGALNACT